MYYIKLEDLVANALIEIIERIGRRTVSFTQTDKYCEAVSEKLRDQNIEAIPNFSSNETDRFFREYSNLFEIKETTSGMSVTLQDGFSTQDLRKRFRMRLSLDLLKAFTCDKAVATLLEGG